MQTEVPQDPPNNIWQQLDGTIKALQQQLQPCHARHVCLAQLRQVTAGSLAPSMAICPSCLGGEVRRSERFEEASRTDAINANALRELYLSRCTASVQSAASDAARASENGET